MRDFIEKAKTKRVFMRKDVKDMLKFLKYDSEGCLFLRFEIAQETPIGL